MLCRAPYAITKQVKNISCYTLLKQSCRKLYLD